MLHLVIWIPFPSAMERESKELSDNRVCWWKGEGNIAPAVPANFFSASLWKMRERKLPPADENRSDGMMSEAAVVFAWHRYCFHAKRIISDCCPYMFIKQLDNNHIRNKTTDCHCLPSVNIVQHASLFLGQWICFSCVPLRSSEASYSHQWVLLWCVLYITCLCLLCRIICLEGQHSVRQEEVWSSAWSTVSGRMQTQHGYCALSVPLNLTSVRSGKNNIFSLWKRKEKGHINTVSEHLGLCSEKSCHREGFGTCPKCNRLQGSEVRIESEFPEVHFIG